MNNEFKAPQEMSFEGNISQNWREFEQELKLYFVATDLTKKSSERKSAILLTLVGKEGRRIFTSFGLSEQDSKNCEYLLDKFREFCSPRENITFERYQLFNRRQKPLETFDAWLTDLKCIASRCQLGALHDELILVQVVSGTRDDKMKQRMLQEENLTLKKAESMSKAKEIACMQLNEMKRQTTEDTSSYPQEIKYMKKNYHQNQTSSNRQFYKKTSNCYKCGGTTHRNYKECFAYGKTCFKCNKMNHFSSCCREKTRNIDYIKDNDPINEEIDMTESLFLG